MVVMAGCDKEEPIRTYQVPSPAVASFTPPQADQTAAPDSGPIQWKLPASWKVLPPHEMRYAGFGISDSDPQAMVTVSQASGAMPEQIRRWEGQLGLPPTPDDQIPTLVKPATIAGTEAAIIDLSAKPKPDGSGQRYYIAVIGREQGSWFIKMLGSAQTVAAELPNFNAFLQSIRFNDSGTPVDASADAQVAAPSSPAPAGPPEPASASPLDFKLPAGWQQKSPDPSGMRIVSLVAGAGESQAESFVVRLPKDSGSVISNVNRWRGQVGLEPVDDVAQADPQAQTVGGEKGTLFDFTGKAGSGESARRLVVALVPHGNDWWFFKLDGSSPAVAQQKGAFLEFLSSVSFRSE